MSTFPPPAKEKQRKTERKRKKDQHLRIHTRVPNGTLCVRISNRDRPIEQEAREKIAKHRNLYNLLPGETSSRDCADAKVNRNDP